MACMFLDGFITITPITTNTTIATMTNIYTINQFLSVLIFLLAKKIFTTGFKTFLCLFDLYLSSYYEKTGLDPPLLLFDFHVIGFPIKDRRYQWTVHNLTLKKTNIILYKILTWRAIIWDLFDDFLSSDLPRGE